MHKGKNTLAPGNIQMCDPHDIADNEGRCALVLLRGKSWCFLAQCVQYNNVALPVKTKINDKQ